MTYAELCGEAARYYFGAPGFHLHTSEGWYCGNHLYDGERAWAARYQPKPD
jgi:hypothetical protein